MKPHRIRTLLIEDNPGDARLVREVLRETPEIEIRIVDRLSLGVKYLTNNETDVVLLDLGLPDSQGLDSLRAVHEAAPNVTVVVLTGQDDEEIGRIAIQQGAQDYIVKPVVPGRTLARILRFAFERKRAGMALRESERLYRELVQNANSAIIRWKSDGTLTFFNEYAQTFFGYSADEIMGRHVGILVPEHESTGGDLTGLIHDIVAHPERYVKNINENVRRDGSRVWMAWTNKPILDENGKVAEVLAVATDITDRKRAEYALRESEEFNRQVIFGASEGVIVYDTHFHYKIWNAFMESLTGIPASQVLGKTALEVFPHLVEQGVDVLIRRALAGETVQSPDTPFSVFQTGKSGWVSGSYSPQTSVTGEIIGAIGIVRDITERKRAEGLVLLAREVLELLNRPEGSADTVRDILQLIKNNTSFEAVGIRIREDDDFPYYEANGFSEDFVQAERYLCARDEEGKIIRDTEGNAVLECMCGNILCSRTDPTLPFFTNGGSFWTNSSTDLLASTAEKDRQARTRNRCNSEGYESVALVPLRSGKEIIGLLQFNDRRRNQFTEEMVHFFEGLGASIGIALSRRRAEDELRESEEKYRTIIENMHEGYYEVDSKGNITFFNEAMRKFLGYEREELLGMNYRQYLEEKDVGKVYQIYNQVYRTAEPVRNLEWQITRKDGDRRDIEVSISISNDRDGRPAGFRGIARDNTERKGAEDSLKESEEKYRALVETTDTGFVIMDENGTVLDANENYVRMTGHKVLDEIRNRNIVEWTSRHDLERNEQAVKKCFDQGFIRDLEISYVNEKGEDTPVEINASVIETKKGRRIISLCRDITERKRAEEELVWKTAFLEAQVEATVDGILVVDDKGKKILVNTNFLNLMEIPRHIRDDTDDEPMLQHVTSLAKHPKQFLEKVIYLYEHPREISRDEIEFKDRMVLDRYSSPVIGKDGKYYGRIWTFRDITERKWAEDKLRKYSAELIEKNEEIREMSEQLWQAAKLATVGELSASIAHELNNPLATVSMRTESLLTKTQQDGPMWRELKIIEQEIERMAILTTNLLQFSRRRQKEISTVDICEEIEKAMELIYYHLRKRNIVIRREFASECPRIHADRQELRQLFLNLFTNASDAMPQGGTLTIRVTAPPESVQVIIEVADTGTGIPPEIMSKVVEPFYTTKPEGKGTGLGLAICRRIVQEHNGIFDLTSEGIPGRGATARISLPINDGTNLARLKNQ
jgi:PAS domain S-box-containing protein